MADRSMEEDFGYGTLDDLAGVLADRTDGDLLEIKARMATYGPDALWSDIVAPMLDKLEMALGLDDVPDTDEAARQEQERA
jgi:hypothetical protein